MINKQKSMVKLILVFLASIMLWIITSSNPEGLNGLWFLFVLVIAVLFIIKNRNITKIDVLTGTILGLIAIPSNLFMGLFTIIAYIGGISIFKRSKNQIVLFASNKSKEIIKSIIIALVVGIILGIINLFLAKGSMSINPSMELKWIIDALRAGITEEIIFRFFFFAICVYFAKDKNMSRIESGVCYLIMILPHVLFHFDRSTFNIFGVIILFLLFGLPFAMMQRKRDLVSAIGAHTVVDLIRFIALGV